MAISNKKTMDGDSRAARRLAKARVPQEYRDHLVELQAEAEELASWFDEEEFYDDDSLCMCIPGHECYKCSVDAERARDQMSGSLGYPDEPPCEFYESGSYLDF